MLEPKTGRLTFRAEGNNVKSSRGYSKKYTGQGAIHLARKIIQA